MPMIPFVQYVLPHGEHQYQMLERPANICAIADKLITAGLKFEAEILTTGMVSITITSKWQDEAMEVFENKPGELSAHADKMITEFDLPAYLKRAARMDAAA